MSWKLNHSFQAPDVADSVLGKVATYHDSGVLDTKTLLRMYHTYILSPWPQSPPPSSSRLDKEGS